MHSKSKFFKNFTGLLLIVIFFNSIVTVSAAEKSDYELEGFLRPLYLKILKRCKSGTSIGQGSIAAESDILALFIIAKGIDFLQEYSRDHTVLNLTKGVLPALKECNIAPNEEVPADKEQELINQMGVDTIITGRVKRNKNGKWVLTMGFGGGTNRNEKEIESDPLDNQAMLRLIDRARAWYENLPDDERSTIKPPPEKQLSLKEAEDDIVYIPPDTSTKVGFYYENIRHLKSTMQLSETLFFAIYDHVKNNPIASMKPALVVFSPDTVLAVLGDNIDNINGVTRSIDGNTFFVYDDNGLVVEYSLESFTEVSRYKNIRSVKQIAFAEGDLLITNPGGIGSKIFDMKTKTEAKVNNKNIKIIDIQASIKTPYRMEVTNNNTIHLFDGNGDEKIQVALYNDGEYGYLLNNRKSFGGTKFIDRHIVVIEYNKEERFMTPADNKLKTKTDNRI